MRLIERAFAKIRPKEFVFEKIIPYVYHFMNGSWEDYDLVADYIVANREPMQRIVFPIIGEGTLARNHTAKMVAALNNKGVPEEAIVFLNISHNEDGKCMEPCRRTDIVFQKNRLDAMASAQTPGLVELLEETYFGLSYECEPVQALDALYAKLRSCYRKMTMWSQPKSIQDSFGRIYEMLIEEFAIFRELHATLLGFKPDVLLHTGISVLVSQFLRKLETSGISRKDATDAIGYENTIVLFLTGKRKLPTNAMPIPYLKLLHLKGEVLNTDQYKAMLNLAEEFSEEIIAGNTLAGMFENMNLNVERNTRTTTLKIKMIKDITRGYIVEHINEYLNKPLYKTDINFEIPQERLAMVRYEHKDVNIYEYLSNGNIVYRYTLVYSGKEYLLFMVTGEPRTVYGVTINPNLFDLIEISGDPTANYKYM